MNRIQRAFTLIELLIVVAIIGILAAIAIPNFLQAQIRSKVARAQADMRELALAAELYVADHNQYPPHRDQATCTELPYHVRFAYFTTPIAYLSRLPGKEIFTPPRPPAAGEQWDIADTFYFSWTNFASYACRSTPHALYPYRDSHAYLVRSRGPDTLFEGDAARNAHFVGEGQLHPDPFVYDPTNGTVSRGDLFRTRVENN